MRMKRTKTISLLLLAVSLLAAILVGVIQRTEPLHAVVSCLLTEDSIYGIDKTESAYCFFMIDSRGLQKKQFSIPVKSGSSYVSYDRLVADGENLYVLERKADIQTDHILAETVFRVDMQRGRLEPAWSLPVRDRTMDNNFSISVRDGILYYFTQSYEGRQAIGRLMRMEPDGAAIERQTFAYDIGIGFTDFYLTRRGTVLFTTPKGEVFAVQGETLSSVFSAEKQAQLALFGNDGRDSVYMVSREGDGYVFRAGTDSTAVFYGDLSAQGEKLRGLSADENGRMLLIAQDGKSLALLSGANAYSIQARRQPIAALFFYAMLGFVAAWIVFCLIGGLIWLFVRLTKGHIPIVSKLLAAFVPVLVLSLLLLNRLVVGLFATAMTERQYARLFLLTQQQMATLNPSYVEDFTVQNAHNDIYYYQTRAAFNVLPAQGTLWENGGSQSQEVSHASYFWLYTPDEQGNLVSMICEQDYMGVPVQNRYSKEVSDLFYQVMDTGKTIKTAFSDRLGDWTVLLTPVTNQDGAIIGVIETGDTRGAMDYAIRQGANRITWIFFAVLGGLGLLLGAIIIISLYPLRVLKEKVLRIGRGELGVQAPVRGHDEVSDITRAFNHMSSNVLARDNEIRQTSEGYARFVPDKVFDLLQKSSVIDVKLEDRADVNAVVLNCAVGGFDSMASEMRSRQLFRLINQVLAELVPVVNQTGGMIDRFDRAGLLAVYTNGSERALDAAITVCQYLRSNAPSEAGENKLDFHVAISAGGAMIGIVGADNRLEAMTISEHLSFTGFLQPLAGRLGAPILMTESAASQIEGFGVRYHARSVGFVYRKALQRAERLYDIYDGDPEDIRQRKEQTRAQFEKGVELFCAHQYYDARLLFIEVLKKNRQDSAAKEYLYLCDTYYREDTEGTRDIWLTTY